MTSSYVSMNAFEAYNRLLRRHVQRAACMSRTCGPQMFTSKYLDLLDPMGFVVIGSHPGTAAKAEDTTNKPDLEHGGGTPTRPSPMPAFAVMVSISVQEVYVLACCIWQAHDMCPEF